MNILILSPFFPWPLSQGGKIRVFNIIKHLARNRKISLACVSDEKISDHGPLADFCEEIICVERRQNLIRDIPVFLFGKGSFNFVRFSSEAFREALRQLLTRKSFDLVQIEFSMMWQYADIFDGISSVLDAHNIESEIVRQIGETQINPLRRFLYKLEEKKIRRGEEKAWRECKICFAVSEKEREVIATHGGKAFTIPNGVDLERFQYVPKENVDRRILLLAGMDYLPNVDSVKYFLNGILPLIREKLPDILLDVVGRDLWKIRGWLPHKGMEFHESVSDILPYLRQADLLVVPLRQGAGTRIKILEAMAAGLPVVATSKGCEGLVVKDGEHLLIADEAGSFAEAVHKILNDAGLGKSLACNARTLVETKYSWEKIVREMEKLWSEI